MFGMRKFIALLFMSVSSLWGTDFLFVLHDYGEINALSDVIKQMDASVAICLKSGARIDPELEPLVLDLPTEKLGRSDLLSEESLEQIVNVQPKVVVTGVSYAYFGQILDALDGAQRLCYWDNFSPDGDGDYFATAKEVASHAETVIVPDEAFVHRVAHAVVMEHPSLDVWSEAQTLYDAEQVKGIVGVEEGKPFVLILGGYGVACDAATSLLESGLKEMGDEIDVWMLPHPKVGESGPFKCISRELGFSTAQLVAAADVVLTHQSTAGVLAAMMGKRVGFFVPENPRFSNLVTELGIANRYSGSAPLRIDLRHLDLWERGEVRGSGLAVKRLAAFFDNML